jgi:hypothetical protein
VPDARKTAPLSPSRSPAPPRSRPPSPRTAPELAGGHDCQK